MTRDYWDMENKNRTSAGSKTVQLLMAAYCAFLLWAYNRKGQYQTCHLADMPSASPNRGFGPRFEFVFLLVLCVVVGAELMGALWDWSEHILKTSQMIGLPIIAFMLVRYARRVIKYIS